MSENLVGWITFIIGIALTVLALSPEDWKTNLAHWHSLFERAGLYRYALIIGLSCLGFGIGFLWHSNDIEVKATRVQWWDSNIQSVIRDSEKLVVMDSAFGHKHLFWEALSERLQSPKPFELVYLMLKDGDPFLARCLEVAKADPSLPKQDKKAIEGLVKTKIGSPYSPNKKMEFYFWEGISPGPLVAWTKDGKETIGLGFWMQLSKATDGTPYAIVKRGPLFDDLKRHYETIINEARSKKAHVLPP